MKHAGGSFPSEAGRLSKAGVVGMRLCRAAAIAAMACVGASTAFADAPVVNYLPYATVSGYMQELHDPERWAAHVDYRAGRL